MKASACLREQMPSLEKTRGSVTRLAWCVSGFSGGRFPEEIFSCEDVVDEGLTGEGRVREGFLGEGFLGEGLLGEGLLGEGLLGKGALR